MRALQVEISDEFIGHSAPDFGTKNAWARLVRNRWPANTVKGVLGQWPFLTEGEARGLVYAQASQPTIDKLLKQRDRFSAFRLGLEVLCTITGIRLEQYIKHEAEEAKREAAKRAAEQRSWSSLHVVYTGEHRLDWIDGQ